MLFLFVIYVNFNLLLSSPTPANVYIADTYNNRVRKVTVSTGVISLIAGTGDTTFSGDDGAATSATLYYPLGTAVDSIGRKIYFPRIVLYVFTSSCF